MKRIKVNKNRYISEKDPCFIVAEMSANHARDLKVAKKIIKAAKKSGADAVKIQTYTPDTMTLDSRKKYFQIKHPKWGGQTLYELYKKAHMPWEWHEDLMRLAKDEGIILFSTPFDKSAVDLLERLDVPLYKIASFELVDIPLIKYIAQTRKPMIISTGMATLGEIKDAVEAAKNNGAKDIILLKCVSSYPADPSVMNLRSIPLLRDKFNVPVGLSDHTLGVVVPIVAISLGVKVVEKHFTLSRSIETPDSFFSVDMSEMRHLVDNIRAAESALGKKAWDITDKEKTSRVYRRSIFSVAEINKGEVFSEDNIRVIRPSHGLKPKYYEDIIGKRSKKSISKGVPLTRSMLE